MKQFSTLVSLFLLVFSISFFACDLAEDEDCVEVTQLVDDAITFNQVGIGNGCPHTIWGQQLKVGMPFYSVFDPGRKFEWTVPAGYVDENGADIPQDYVSDEPVITVFATDRSPENSTFQLRVTNNCFESNTVSSTVTVYGAPTVDFAYLAPLPEGRANAVVVKHNGDLYVLYGANYDNALEYRYVNYRYKENTDSWEILPTPAGVAALAPKINKGTYVKEGSIVYMLDENLRIFAHDLSNNTFEEVGDFNAQSSGAVSDQGAGIFAGGGKLFVGPINNNLFVFDPAAGTFTGGGYYAGFNNVEIITSHWTDGNRHYFFRQRNSAIEYNMSLGVWKTIPMRVDFVNSVFRSGNDVYIQTSDIPSGNSLVRRWDLQTGEFSPVFDVTYPACLNTQVGILGGRLYMSTTYEDAGDIYLIGGGDRHDSNGKAGFGSSTVVGRLRF